MACSTGHRPLSAGVVFKRNGHPPKRPMSPGDLRIIDQKDEHLRAEHLGCALGVRKLDVADDAGIISVSPLLRHLRDRFDGQSESSPPLFHLSTHGPRRPSKGCAGLGHTIRCRRGRLWHHLRPNKGRITSPTALGCLRPTNAFPAARTATDASPIRLSRGRCCSRGEGRLVDALSAVDFGLPDDFRAVTFAHDMPDADSNIARVMGGHLRVAMSDLEGVCRAGKSLVVTRGVDAFSYHALSERKGFRHGCVSEPFVADETIIVPFKQREFDKYEFL